MQHQQDVVKAALAQALADAKQFLGTGLMPGFIPALADIDPDRLSISLTDLDGNTHTVGNYNGRFSIQSISKIILYELALRDAGEDTVFSKIGVEPSGNGFHSLYRLELLEKKPSNPLINPGAITSASCIKGANLEEKFERFRALAGELLGNPGIEYDSTVSECEMKTGHRNRALASMLIDNGVLEGDPEECLEIYYRGCALYAGTAEVSYFGAILANDGVCPRSKRRLLAKERCELFRALMATCGMYDSTGRYAVEVGIPAKSGSGGGIIAAARGKAGLGVYSPRLDGRGNSVCGMKALQSLANHLDLRVY